MTEPTPYKTPLTPFHTHKGTPGVSSLFLLRYPSGTRSLLKSPGVSSFGSYIQGALRSLCARYGPTEG